MVFKHALWGILFANETRTTKGHVPAPASQPARPAQQYQLPTSQITPPPPQHQRPTPHHSEPMPRRGARPLCPEQLVAPHGQSRVPTGQYLIRDSMSRERVLSNVKSTSFTGKSGKQDATAPSPQATTSTYMNKGRWA